jgi:hypothetical protein
VHHVVMTPDAAGIFAAVNATVLIALTVDANSQENHTKSGHGETSNPQEESKDKAWYYKFGIWLTAVCIGAVVLSLSMTLVSVEVWKPLTGVAQHIAVDAAAAGFAPLVYRAIVRLTPEICKPVIIAAAVLALVIFILFQVWLVSFAPGTDFISNISKW